MDLSNYDLRSHDRALASWLARYSYGDADADSAGRPALLPPAPPALACAFRLGPVRKSLGITIPLVWLANLSCDFRGAYERRATATATATYGSPVHEDDLDDGDDSDDGEGGGGTARAGRRRR